MDLTKVRHVRTFLSILVFIQSTDSHVLSHEDARSINGPAPGSFADRLFEEYGTNKSMSLQQFNSLLKELNVGSITRETKNSNGLGQENAVKNGHSKVSQT